MVGLAGIARIDHHGAAYGARRRCFPLLTTGTGSSPGHNIPAIGRS